MSKYKSLFFLVVLLLIAAYFIDIDDPGLDFSCILEKKFEKKLDERVGWSCLHYAAAKGDLYRMRKMLANDADIEFRDSKGKTPIYIASKYGSLEAVELLNKEGADIHTRSEHPSFSILHVAAEFNHHDIVQYLTESGIEIDIKNDWQQTPLHQASWRFADANMIRLLVKNGADVNAHDKKGFTPLHKATSHKETDILDTLLELNADINIMTDQGTTPLMYAARRGNYNAVEFLLKRGAEIEKREGYRSAYSSAKKNGHTEIVTLLASYGAFDTLRNTRNTRQSHEEKLASLNDTIESNPWDTEALRERGRFYLGKKDYDAALQDYLALLEMEPGNIAALESAAWIYLQKRNYEQSIDYYTRVIENDSENGRAYHNRAGIYARLGDMDKAIDEVKIACDYGYQDGCMMYERLTNN